MFFYADLKENENSDAHAVQINMNQVAKITMRRKDGARLYEFFSAHGISLGKKEIMESNVQEISHMEEVISRG